MYNSLLLPISKGGPIDGAGDISHYRNGIWDVIPIKCAPLWPPYLDEISVILADV